MSGFLAAGQIGPTMWLNYSSIDGSINITLGSQSAFVIDDGGYSVPYYSTPAFVIEWHQPNITFNGALMACFDALTHWNHWVIDPSLGVLFAPIDPTPSSPPSSNSHTVAIAVCVSVVIVAAIIGALAFLSLKHSGFRNAVRPFFKRKQ